MTALKIFEKVNLIMPLEQRRFLNYLEDTVEELWAMFGGFVFCEDKEYAAPQTLSEDLAVLPLYHGAIVDNIVFLAGGEEGRKSEFIRKSHEAYLKYWNDNAKGRRMKMLRRW